MNMKNMNDEDIRQFLTAYGDFMRHAETEMNEFDKREEARAYAERFYQKQVEHYEEKAAELEVTVDYYMAEFL